MIVTIVSPRAPPAGRDPDALLTAAFLPTCVTEDIDAAHASLARQIAAFAKLVSYRRSMGRRGFEGDVMRAAAAGEGVEADAVSARLVASLAALGPAGAVASRVQELRLAGVRLPIIAPVALPGERGWQSMAETWSALAPTTAAT